MNCLRGIQSFGRTLCVMCVVTTGAAWSTSAQTVTYNYADRVNFSQYKTYQWVNIEGGSATDPTLNTEIQTAIDTQLAARGISKSADGAQLLIGYQISQARVIEISMLKDHHEYGPGWSDAPWFGYSLGFIVNDVSRISTDNGMEIPFGHLVVDAYDSSHHDLVWRGRVTQAITFGPDLQKRGRLLNKAATKLIQAFPHGPKD